MAAQLRQGDRRRVCMLCERTMPAAADMVWIRSLEPGTSSLESRSFSTPMTTPSLHFMPTTVPAFSTALVAYSTWKMRPSGLNVVGERS